MRLLVGTVFLLSLTGSAFALTVDGSGNITNWGVTPFSNWGPPAGTISNGGLDNNWSPVNYPGGVGNVPSPGGAAGEPFDLEGGYIRKTGGNFEVLLITSMALAQTLPGGGYAYRLGDWFIDTDGNDSQYEFALITQDPNNKGFVAGQLRTVTSTYGIISNHQGYGGNTTVRNQVNPWALKSGSLLASGTFSQAFYSYLSGAEPTHIYEWIIPYAALGLTGDETISMHMTIECGNDLIEFGGQFPSPQPEPVPEPTTVVLVASALAGLIRPIKRRFAAA